MNQVAKGRRKGEHGKEGGLAFSMDFMGLGGTEYWCYLCMAMEQGEMGHGAFN
jgi:hypothetical protein